MSILAALRRAQSTIWFAIALVFLVALVLFMWSARQPSSAQTVGWTGPLPAVDLASVSDAYHGHDQLLVHDLVQDAVVALADPVLVVATELFGAHGPRVLGEGSDSGGDAVAVFGRYGFEFPGSRPRQDNAITCHVASNRGQRFRTILAVL